MAAEMAYSIDVFALSTYLPDGLFVDSGEYLPEGYLEALPQTYVIAY